MPDNDRKACRFCGYSPSHGTYYLVTPGDETWQCESLEMCRSNLKMQVGKLERTLRRVQANLGGLEGKWGIEAHAERIFREHREMRAELDRQEQEMHDSLTKMFDLPTPRLKWIRDTGPKARRIDPVVVAEALGADVATDPRTALHSAGPIDQRVLLNAMDPILPCGRGRLCCELLENEIRAGVLIHVDNFIGFPSHHANGSVIHGAVRPIWHCPWCGTKLSKWLGGEP